MEVVSSTIESPAMQSPSAALVLFLFYVNWEEIASATFPPAGILLPALPALILEVSCKSHVPPSLLIAAPCTPF